MRKCHTQEVDCHPSSPSFERENQQKGYVDEEMKGENSVPLEEKKVSSLEPKADENSSSKRRPRPSDQLQDWQVENSPLWWMNLEFFQRPGNFLFLSSVPLCMGAVYGYLQPANKVEEWVGDAPPSDKKGASTMQQRVTRRIAEKEAEIFAARQLGFQMATRALGLATIGTVGTFGLLGAGRHFTGVWLRRSLT